MLRLAPRPVAPEHADDGAPLEQREVQRNLRDLARRKTDDEEPSAPRDRAQRGLGVRAAHRIVDDVRAGAVGERLDPLAQIVGGVVDRLVGAVFAADSELILCRCAGDHARAQDFPDLDRGQADAAGRPEDEQRLAGCERGAVDERVLRRAVGEPERGGCREIHRGRNGKEAARFGCHFFREGAVARDRHHAIARLERRHAVADRLDDARQLAPRRKGQRRLHLILVLDDQDVGEVDTRRLHCNHHFARTRHRRRHVLDDQ